MKIIIIILLLGLFSCDTKPQHKQFVDGVKMEKVYTHIDFKVYSVTLYEYTMSDSCQYIGYLGSDDRDNFLTHKGTCNNSKHKE